MQMTSLTSLPHKLINYDSLESVRKSPVSSVMDSQMMMMNKSSSFRLSSGGCGSLLDLTPSPSDSGVSELEAALRDRDSELAYLRQTMEHNEQVIFRVYEEKERVWERELRRLKNVHENRLRANAQKTLKLEQMLMTQTYQLQQDKKRLLAETQRASCQSERLRQEVCTLRSRLEETEWALCQKTGEISLLKSQLKDYQHEQTIKGHEFLQLKTDYRDLRVALEMKEEEIETLQKINLEKDDEIALMNAQLKNFQYESDDEEDLDEPNELIKNHLQDNLKDNIKDNLMDNLKLKEEKLRLKEEIKELRKELSEVSMSEYDGLEAGRNLRCKRIGDQLQDFQDFNKEMDSLRNELEERKKDFEKERVIWAQEKEKVLRYQRQLQMNYVQMYRRTRALEDEVEALTIELELDKTGHKQKISSTTDLTQTIEL
nr:leucine zipper putative tumor suppressor 2 homolog [Onthophagus taurus]